VPLGQLLFAAIVIGLVLLLAMWASRR